MPDISARENEAMMSSEQGQFPTGTLEYGKRTENGDFSKLHHEKIARLAYSLWERRGRPFGSPEIDWCRAELELATLISPL